MTVSPEAPTDVPIYENVYRFRRVKNGYVVRVESTHDDPHEIVHAEDDFHTDEKEAFASFLRYIESDYGPASNRYDKRKIHIDLRPGSKCEFIDDIEWFVREVMYVDAAKLTPENFEAARKALNAIFHVEHEEAPLPEPPPDDHPCYGNPDAD